jgi:hypothetical protein
MRTMPALRGSIAAILLLTRAVTAETESTPATSKFVDPESFVGQRACDLHLQPGLEGLYSEPFDKDPATLRLLYLKSGAQRFILVASFSEGDDSCGRVVGVARFEYPLGDRSRTETLSFHCAALEQRYDRYKAYVGVFEADRLEYTRAKRAWVFDVNTYPLSPYKRVQNVYCPNLIAD